MRKRIEVEPDPMIPAARSLAEEINRRQTTVMVSGGIGYSMKRTSETENDWLRRYRQAEKALEREAREADRAARRAK